MSKTKVRMKASVDAAGNYSVHVQLHRGFWSGWKTIRQIEASGGRGGRDPAECVRMAREYMQDLVGVELGVLK